MLLNVAAVIVIIGVIFQAALLYRIRRHNAMVVNNTATNSGSPKCYCCGSENVIIECGSCKERRVFGTWSSQ